MILGRVNIHTEAVIPLTIRHVTGQGVTHDSIIDTGFSGYLTLPRAAIAALQLSFLGSRTFSLGNNAQANLDLYIAIVIWDGQEREINVVSSEAQPLVRMSLLKGFRLTIDAIDGGEVRIESRP